MSFGRCWCFPPTTKIGGSSQSLSTYFKPKLNQMIGLSVKYNYYIIGHSSLLSAFFDTVHYHLEKDNWGSRFPVFSNDFYKGEVRWEDAEKLIENVEEIRRELKVYKPKDVIWDINDLSKRPPWGDDIDPDITSFADYFCTSSGAHDLIDVIIEALNKGIELKENIKVK